jgi:hypothetical protein
MARADRFVRFALLLAAFGASERAKATLGEQESTLDRDSKALSMARGPATAKGEFTVHEMRSPTATVREFVAPSGKIFAVAWAGVVRPDLTTLLGAYHAEYRAAASGPRTARGPRRVESANVVVETWGHARSLHGRAYIPSLVPTGANLDDIR